MRFLTLSGHRPNFSHCSMCGLALEDIESDTIAVNVQRGGILCGNCSTNPPPRLSLAKGTIKQLLWVESGKLAKTTRIKFIKPAQEECTNFLEEFVCYHLGKEPRSLKFLRQIRKGS
jgi:DNA repair protein RecO (recombination protein O)